MCPSHCVVDAAVCVLVPYCFATLLTSDQGIGGVNASGYAYILKLELAVQALRLLVLLVACMFSDGSYCRF